MQGLKPQKMRKLKENLKSCLKRESLLADIFIFGSSLKSKKRPNDIDIICLFREKRHEEMEDILYKIKKIGDALELALHIEPCTVDNFYNKQIFVTLLHEGFSIANNDFLSSALKFKSYFLVTYSLGNKKPSEKVRFSYALYGRKKGEGLLKTLEGKELGKSAVLVPVKKEQEMKDFFGYWDVNFGSRRICVFE